MQSFKIFAEELARASDKCIFTLNLNATIESANEACSSWFGEGGPIQWSGKQVEELVADRDLLSMFNEARQSMAAGDSEFALERLVNRNESPERLTLSCRQICNRDGQAIGYGYSIETKAAADSDFERIMLRNLMKNCQDLIFFKDLDSRFTRVSDSMVERLGANSLEEVIGKSDFDFWDLASATKFFDAEQDIIRTQVPVSGKTETAVRTNGDVNWSLTSKMPLIDDAGNVVGTFGVNKDITKEKRIEQKLESTHDELVKASRRAGMAEVAACVLHNVGNVLNSINIAVFQADKATKGLMIRGVEKSAALISENAAVERFLVNDERGKMLPEYLNQLAASMRQDQQEISADLNSAINYLEHVKAIVSTQQKYATGGRILEEVDLSEVLEDAIGMSSRSLARHEISLVRDFEAGITVSTDKHRLLQTLVNLIRNAKQALKAVQRPDKQLTLKIEQIQSGTISILIQDNGIGIEKGNLLKLFNHGFTDRKDGNGFGLHSGANFAQELGGSLVASSEGIGCGATFTLTIPIDPTAASGDVEGVFGLPSSVHGGLSTDSSSAEV